MFVYLMLILFSLDLSSYWIYWLEKGCRLEKKEKFAEKAEDISGKTLFSLGK